MVIDTANAFSVGSAHLLGESGRARAKRAREHALSPKVKAPTPKIAATEPTPPKRTDRGPVRPYAPPPVKDPNDPEVIPHDKLMADLLARTNDPVRAERLAKKFNALSAEQQRKLLESRKARRQARRAALEREQEGAGGARGPRSPDDPDRPATDGADEALLEDTALPLPDDLPPDP